MRADQLLMLGVVGLGAYAVYRMVTTSASAGEKSSSSTSKPDVPILLPARPTEPAIPAGILVAHPILGGRADFKNSRAYRMRIETVDTRGRIGAHIRPTDSTEAIAETLALMGFDNAQAFASPRAASAAGFPAWSLAGAGQGTRWAYGRWTPPTTSLVPPSELSLVWVGDATERPDALSGYTRSLGSRAGLASL